MNNIKNMYGVSVGDTHYLATFKREGRVVDSGKKSMSLGTTVAGAAKRQVAVSESGNRFAVKYNEFREAQYRSPASHYINLSKVLYDPELDVEVAMVDNEEVSDDTWTLMLESEKQFDIEISVLKSELTPLWAKHYVAKYLGIIYDVDEIESSQKSINDQISKLTINKKQWSDFADWMKKLLSSQDGVNNAGFMKMRVFNLYQQIINASKKDKIRLLDLVSEYNLACSDRAVVGLEKAEVLAQFINVGEDLKLNVLILEFKRHLIQTELVSAASPESVASYLFYSLYFNEILGLRNQNKMMSHVSLANKRSFDESIDAIFKRITVEDLVGFISSHEMFQEAYFQEYMKIVDRLQGEIGNLDYDDPKIGELNNEYHNVTNYFYQDRARKLLLTKGFITNNVGYLDPAVLPGTNMLEPKQLGRRLMANAFYDPFMNYLTHLVLDCVKSCMLLFLPENFVHRFDIVLWVLSALLVLGMLSILSNFLFNLSQSSILSHSGIIIYLLPIRWVNRIIPLA